VRNVLRKQQRRALLRKQHLRKQILRRIEGSGSAGKLLHRRACPRSTPLHRKPQEHSGRQCHRGAAQCHEGCKVARRAQGEARHEGSHLEASAHAALHTIHCAHLRGRDVILQQLRRNNRQTSACNVSTHCIKHKARLADGKVCGPESEAR